MEIIRVKDYDEMSAKACAYIIEEIKKSRNPVLGLATGSTPEGVYNLLNQQYKEQKVSFKNVSSFNLDEYVGVGNENLNSYHYYMSEKLFKHIDIEKENVHIPNGLAGDMEKECQDYEKQIEAEKIDVQILGLGLNGHIGFNEPGTPFSSKTHIVTLDESTRKANERFFNSPEEVPKRAITMGIDSIMQSKMILLLVSGQNKREALRRLLNDELTEEFPASILKKHGQVTIIADEAALEG